MSSLSDGIIALKAKNFLANLTFELVKLVEEITPTGKWEERIEALIQNSLSKTFKLNPNQDAAQQSKSFLQGLGFTPSEVLWKDDMRQGKIHLGTSRLWEVDMNDVTSHLIVSSIVKTICALILNGDANLRMLTDQELPPRYKIGFEFSDERKKVFVPQKGEIGEKKADVPSIESAALMEPFLGRKISSDDAFECLLTATHSYLKENAPDQLEKYDSSTPSHLLFLALDEGLGKNTLRETGNEIGKRFKARLVDELHSDLKPNHIIKNIGLLSIENLSDIMFYGKEKFCSTLSKDFCNFIVFIWEEFISQTLQTRFVAEEPLCSTSATSLCIYSFKRA